MSRPSYALQITTSRLREIRDLLSEHVNASSDLDVVRTECAVLESTNTVGSFVFREYLHVDLTKQELLGLMNARLETINAKLRALNVGVVEDMAAAPSPTPETEENTHDHAAV